MVELCCSNDSDVSLEQGSSRAHRALDSLLPYTQATVEVSGTEEGGETLKSREALEASEVVERSKQT